MIVRLRPQRMQGIVANQPPNPALQPTANPFHGLSAAELSVMRKQLGGRGGSHKAAGERDRRFHS